MLGFFGNHTSSCCLNWSGSLLINSRFALDLNHLREKISLAIRVESDPWSHVPKHPFLPFDHSVRPVNTYTFYNNFFGSHWKFEPKNPFCSTVAPEYFSIVKTTWEFTHPPTHSLQLRNNQKCIHALSLYLKYS